MILQMKRENKSNSCINVICLLFPWYNICIRDRFITLNAYKTAFITVDFTEAISLLGPTVLYIIHCGTYGAILWSCATKQLFVIFTIDYKLAKGIC